MAVAGRKAEVESAGAGFFGKVPSHGDFVSNRIDRRLRERLDSWLQRGMAESRRRLDHDWNEAFAQMPAWRFALGGEVADGAPSIGVMAASADRVGREFPIILVQRLPLYSGSTRALCGFSPWFDAAEALLQTTQDEAFDIDWFDEMLSRLPAVVFENATSKEADAGHYRSFWWSEDQGSSRFASVGLPAAAEFHRLLASEPQKPTAVRVPAPVPAPPRKIGPPPVVVGVAVSNAGTRHRINADAWISQPGVYAVADGVGDLPSAADAARFVLGKLKRIDEAETIDDLVRHAKGAVGGAHVILRAGSPPEESERPCASLAALLVTGAQCAAVWAGDARCYLLRAGSLRQLTRDHVEIGINRKLVRSVGGSGQFALDTVLDDLAADDRFILCTAPLAAALNERLLASVAAECSPDDAAERLVQEALIAGVAGNVTALVLHARPAE